MYRCHCNTASRLFGKQPTAYFSTLKPTRRIRRTGYFMSACILYRIQNLLLATLIGKHRRKLFSAGISRMFPTNGINACFIGFALYKESRNGRRIFTIRLCMEAFRPIPIPLTTKNMLLINFSNHPVKKAMRGNVSQSICAKSVRGARASMCKITINAYLIVCLSIFYYFSTVPLK